MPDARVAAAAAHWGYRFIANGTDYGDFTATLSRITHWADWCREWGVTASRYEQLAEAAEDAGQRETAVGAWRRAALAWHWGKFVFMTSPSSRPTRRSPPPPSITWPPGPRSITATSACSG